MNGNLLVVRHAETTWSAADRLTGSTEVPLTPGGESQAGAVGELLAERKFSLALVSPMKRTRRTADIAGVSEYEIETDLMPWVYGADEGRRLPQLCRERPGWSLFREGPVGGEDVSDVSARVDRVIARILAHDGPGDILVVGHSHVLQVLAARWLGLTGDLGSLFALDTASLGVLEAGGTPRLIRWNLPVTRVL